LVVLLATLGLFAISVSVLGARESFSSRAQRSAASWPFIPLQAETPSLLTPSPRGGDAASWRLTPLGPETLQGRAPEEFVYLELIEENTDTFEEQLFKAKRRFLPAPFVFEDGVLRVDAQLIQASDPELGIFIEAGESGGQAIFLAHWNFYSGVGRHWDSATYYILNEPSGSVAMPHYSGDGAIHYTPFDSLVDTLDVRMPGQTFHIPEAAKDGSVRFALDGQTITLKPGEHHVLGTQTHQAVVTELTPYGSTVDYGKVTFTTQVTLYNYGSPMGVEFVNTDAGKGGN